MAIFGNINTSFNTSFKNDIESLWYKIMSPIKKEIDPNLTAQFCNKLNSDLDGGQLVLDMITSKMQSNQEWEAIIALYVLEACVQNCGERFHDLIGRFRFLNEMIKLVSPKYYANKTSDKIKNKVIELLYLWSECLTQPKIKEAYQMLKNQGIVKKDPTYVEKFNFEIAPRMRNPIFEDEEKSKQLSRLLKSKNPHDLEMANRLIKNMVKQEELKIERTSYRINELEHINNNMKLLGEMLLNYNKSIPNDSETETIKYLYEELIKLKPSLVKLATETDDNDDAIGDILKANDLCERIINQYKEIFEKGSSVPKTSDNDVNLVNLSMDSNFLDGSNETNSKDLKIYDQKINYNPLKELEDLFSNPTIESTQSELQKYNYDFMGQLNKKPFDNGTGLVSLNNVQSQIYQNSKTNKNTIETKINAPTPQIKAIHELNELGRSMIEKSLNDPKVSLNEIVNLASEKQTQPNKILSLNEIQNQKMSSNTSTNFNQNTMFLKDKLDNLNISNDLSIFNSLNNLEVRLESIKPSNIQPLNLYDKNNLKIVMHFARDPTINNINIIVLSVTSSNTISSLHNFNFQVAAPKTMKIKLQPASRIDLPVYNPLLPLTPITQIILIANPNKEIIRLKYKLNYSFGDNIFNESEEVIQLPDLNEIK